MNYPWQPGVTPGDDVDSLQADVMRFIAIFGLCLAAIFSLVREGEHEYAAMEPREPVVAQPSVPAAAEEVFTANPRESKSHEQQLTSSLESKATQQVAMSKPDARPDAEPVREADIEPPQPEPGFTLQFESSAVLHALMLQGAIQVYARSGDTYHLMDGRGRLQEARPPAMYYGMDPATLPDSIRAASGAAEWQGVEWMVTLPRRTARDIVDLMRQHENGVLIIDSDASVRRHEHGVGSVSSSAPFM